MSLWRGLITDQYYENKFRKLFIIKARNWKPNKMQKTNNTDLYKNKPGKPPTSADFSKTDQERSINGRLLIKRKTKTGKANMRVPNKSIKALYRLDALL